MNVIESILRRLRRAVGIERQQGQTFRSKAYSFILNLVTMGRGIPRVINGEKMLRLDPIFRFQGERYEPEVCAWLKQQIKQGDVVIDVGAQIGLYAMFFARWVGTEGHVFAFDPSPEAVRLLNRHIVKNDLAGRISVIASAAGENNGTAVLHAAGADPTNTLVVGAGSQETIQVPIIRLDSFCSSRQLRPSVIKIDTEGWELPILRGAGELLKDENITWVVEMHPYAWTDAGYTRADFEALLQEYRMEVVPLTGQADPLATYGDTFLRRLASSAA